jgi:hypothetical protein
LVHLKAVFIHFSYKAGVLLAIGMSVQRDLSPLRQNTEGAQGQTTEENISTHEEKIYTIWIPMTVLLCVIYRCFQYPDYSAE